MVRSLVPTDWVPPSKCRDCGSVNDGATFGGPEPWLRPKPGNVSICVYCRCISIFAEDLSLREPTIDEMLAIARTPNVQKALKFIALNPHRK